MTDRDPLPPEQTQIYSLLNRLRAAVRGVLPHAENSIPALRAILDYIEAVCPEWASDDTLRGYADACSTRMKELNS